MGSFSLMILGCVLALLLPATTVAELKTKEAAKKAGPKVTHKVFFDVEIDGAPAGDGKERVQWWGRGRDSAMDAAGGGT
jgi:hypothetical protein